MMEEAEVHFKDYLSTQKLKYTPERRKIFHEIFNSTDHFDAEELFIRLQTQNKSVSRATVYRTLDLLVKLGLVRKVCLGDKSSLYESIVNWKRHGHLVCLSCGKIQEFTIPRIDQAFEKVCREFNFLAQNRCVQISGYCERCKSESIVKIKRNHKLTH